MVDITKMKRMEGESEQAFWERKFAADPDVIITDRGTIRVLHREGESPEEYSARLQAASPPLSEDQKEVLRAAGREYWAIVAQRERDRRNIDG